MALMRRNSSLAWRLRALCVPLPEIGIGESGGPEKALAVTGGHPPSSADLSCFQLTNSRAGHDYGFHRSIVSFPGFLGSRQPKSPEQEGPSQEDGGHVGEGPNVPSTEGLGSQLDSSFLHPDQIIEATAVAESAALSAASEDSWLPTKVLQWALETVHESTGLPWWQTIAATTFLIRLATFPVMLMQLKNTYRLSQARPEIERLLENLKEEQAKGNADAIGDYQRQVAMVWTKHKANPLKSLATLMVQAPLFIGFFSALRGLAAAKVPSLATGGALWFPDLTIADPTYALPVIASATFLLIVEVGAADGMEGQTDVMKRRMKNIMRGVAVVIVPFTLSLPASVFMYWTTSNLFSLGQTLLLKVPSVKKVLGVPDLKAAAKAREGQIPVGKPLVTFTQKPRKSK